MSAGKQKLDDWDYTRLADFHYALRRFLEFSEKAAAALGLTPQQHQALLVIRASHGGNSATRNDGFGSRGADGRK